MIIQLLMIAIFCSFACNPCIVEILLIIKVMVEPILANFLYHLVDHKCQQFCSQAYHPLFVWCPVLI